MEKRDAVIHVCNKQTIDGENETIEMSVVGTFCTEEGGWRLEYTEYDDEARSCHTTVRVAGEDAVYVTREGDFGGEMLFEKGRRNSTAYSTPYGELMMGVYTKSVENSLGVDGGRLRFTYTTDFYTQSVIHNQMTLTVSPSGNV